MGEAAVLAALQRKFTNNAMDLCDEEHTSALFNTIGRVNHDCVGNCEHFYVAEHGVMLLVAHKRIAIGEELFFSYVNDCATHAERTAKLRHWGITACRCAACAEPAGAAGAALDQMAKLDAAMLAQGARGKTERALRTGRELLQLYAEHSNTCGCSLSPIRLQPRARTVAGTRSTPPRSCCARGRASTSSGWR